MLVTKHQAESPRKDEHLQRIIIFNNLIGHLGSSGSQLLQKLPPHESATLRVLSLLKTKIHRERRSWRKKSRPSVAPTQESALPFQSGSLSGTTPCSTCSLAAKQPSTAGHPGPGAPGFVSTALPWAGATDFKQRNRTSSSPVHQAFPEKNQGRGGDKKIHEEGRRHPAATKTDMTALTSALHRWRCRSVHDVALVQTQKSEDQGSWCCNFRLSTPGWGSASTPLGCPVDWRGLLTLCLSWLPTHMSVSACSHPHRQSSVCLGTA